MATTVTVPRMLRSILVGARTSHHHLYCPAPDFGLPISSSNIATITTNTALRTLWCQASPVTALPMKAGTVIPGLHIRKDQDPPVVLERSQYPDWVLTLTQPKSSLAHLKRIPNEEATDEEIRRYLRLTRRVHLRKRNEAANLE